MAPIARTSRSIAALLVVVALSVTACGDADQDAAGTNRDPAAQVADFCDAVDALDATDGTTEASVVLDALGEMRRTAPDEIRAEVILTSDHLIANDYPDAADAAAAPAPLEEVRAAGSRLGAYVDEHCERGS